MTSRTYFLFDRPRRRPCFRRRWSAVLMLLGAGFLFLPTAAAAPLAWDTSSELEHAVRKMNAWMAGSPNAEGWRRYLRINVLESQVAQGPHADLATLQKLHDQLSQPVSGLDHPRFVEVRQALERQIASLAASREAAWDGHLAMARQGFQPISGEEFERQRGETRQHCQALMEYYEQRLADPDRAQWLKDLRYEELIKALNELQFDPAPARSVGKVESEIRDWEARRRDVVQQLDALPLPQENQDPEQKPTPQEVEQQQQRNKLEQQRNELDAQIETLRAERAKILDADRSRRNLRAATFRNLRALEANLNDQLAVRADPFIVALVESWEKLVRTYFYGTDDNLEEDYLRRLDALEAELGRMDGPEARDASGKVGDTLRWLENANQAAALVMAVRSRYSQPNVHVTVAGDFINEVAGQQVVQSRPVSQTVSGRLTQGSATTQADITIDLVEDPHQVHASVHLWGGLLSDTFIKQGPLKVCTQTLGALEARRSIYANVGGLYANQPYLAANLQTQLTGTSSSLRLVNRIVEKKFSESRDSAQGEAARQAETELRTEFQRQTDEALADARQSLDEMQQKSVDRSDRIPSLYLRTGANEVIAVGRKDSVATLAAANAPTDHPVDPQIHVRVHESLLNNLLDKPFAGKTFTDSELADKIEELLGEAPAGLTGKPKDGQEPEHFSISFAQVRPIQFEFEDQGFRIVVSGRRFSQGDQQIDAGLKIILKFKVQEVEGALKLVRDGKVDFAYDDPERTTPKIVAFRSFLDGRLNEDLNQEETEKELPRALLPIDQFEGLQDSDIPPRLHLVQFRSDGGWLQLGWNYLPDGQAGLPETWQMDLPAIWK